MPALPKINLPLFFQYIVAAVIELVWSACRLCVFCHVVRNLQCGEAITVHSRCRSGEASEVRAKVGAGRRRMGAHMGVSLPLR